MESSKAICCSYFSLWGIPTSISISQLEKKNDPPTEHVVMNYYNANMN